jgi:hypothetical protein
VELICYFGKFESERTDFGANEPVERIAMPPITGEPYGTVVIGTGTGVNGTGVKKKSSTMIKKGVDSEQ